ncbi:uncharacterized protein LOC100888977 [Strongylocentrotus purpuratus]|uniref:Ig-like domain-containing protein n=1 Tax=Strongylocentrotus purpuratus TaxID=7668 RepID=A0A7M7PDY8_STRPU|nr:uncharacterized protein LOC100888977 [Strongylocentrotus purpuratus]
MSYAANDLYVRQGRDVTIPCMLNVTQSNIESLVWQKITNKITNSTQGSDTLYTFVNETSRVWQSPLRGYVVNFTDLVLLNVSLSHDGAYKCQILTQSALQPIESETYLHVILPLLEIEVRKTGTVINNGEIIELLHGEETDVECAVVGNVSPSVELRWVTSEDHNQTDGSTAMHHVRGGQTLPLESRVRGSTNAADLIAFGRDEASKTIYPSRGGTIQLPHHGISLCIPALALQRKCKITLKPSKNNLRFDKIPKIPNLMHPIYCRFCQVLPKPSGVLFAEDEAIVSPGVVCEPSGTTFALPLKLVIPHCAVLTDPSKAKVTMYVTHGDKNVTKEELSLTGTPRCVVRKDDLEVYINHFSICEMFMVISDYLIGKRVASTPFLPKSMSRLQPQHCHLRLYNDTPGLEDLIETEEEKLDYRKMAPTKKMFVLWEKGELKIRCEVDSGHVTENEKTVSLDDIYRLDRNIVSFLVKATGDADVYFKFNFHPHCDEGHAFKANFSGSYLGILA